MPVAPENALSHPANTISSRAGGLTLYVMKTSMRKNDRNTDAPYSAARLIRADTGSGVLQRHGRRSVSHGSYHATHAPARYGGVGMRVLTQRAPS